MNSSPSDGCRDRIVIRNLELRCVIGVNDWERLMRQRVVVDIELRGDFSAAADSDDLAEAVDYREVCTKAAQVASDGEYRLLETLADRIAQAVLEAKECIAEVTVGVFKPLALAGFGEAEARVEVRRQTDAH